MNEPLDLVGVLIAILAYLVSKDVASVVGPYAAIVILACTGAAFALSGSEEKMSNGRAVWFVAIRVLLAVALTVSIAELLQKFAPEMKPRYTLAPIAFGIGLIRDYEQVRSWVGGVVRGVLERFIAKKTDAP